MDDDWFEGVPPQAGALSVVLDILG